MKQKYPSWIILSYIFIRPFVCAPAFVIFDRWFSAVFLLAAFLYVRRKKYRISGIDIAVLLFFLSLAASCLASSDIITSINQLSLQTSLIALFYIARSAAQKDNNRFITTLMIGAIAVALYNLRTFFVIKDVVLTYLTSQNIAYPFAHEFLGRARSFAPFASPNLLAAYLAIACAVAAGIALEQNKQNTKGLMFYISLACFGCTLVALFFTKSLGGWFALLIALLILYTQSSKITLKTLLPLVAILGIFLYVITVRMQSLSYIGQPAFSFRQRLGYWEETVRIIKEKPFTGVGIGTLSLSGTRSAHNTYLQLMAETGIGGIIGWLLLVFIFLRKGIVRLKMLPNYRDAGMLAGGIAFLCYNLVDSGLPVPQLAFIWWIIFGLFSKNTQQSRDTVCSGDKPRG